MSFDNSFHLSRQHVMTSQKSSITSAAFDIRTEESMRQHSKKKVNKSNKNISPAFYEFTEVFVWGDDQMGQLGLYHQKVKKGTLDQTSFKVPKTCSFNIIISQISCGESHSAILTNQGHLYMMGNNVSGQLGIGDNCPDLNNKDQAGAPCLVDTLKDLRVTLVECGAHYTIAVAESKNPDYHKVEQKQYVFGWGINQMGQIGIESAKQKFDCPQQITFFDDQGIRIQKVSCGLEHTLFVSDQGQVYSCGNNAYGQLGLRESQLQVTEPSLIQALCEYNIIDAKAGSDFSLFLTSDGEVFSCGSNQNHQLGIQEILTTTFTPVKISAFGVHKIHKIEASSHSAAISHNGELFLWGKGIFGQYRTPQKILTISNKVEYISLGDTLGAAVDCKGLLWTWGYNQHGELGVGDNDPRIHPYPVLSLKGKKVTQISCGSSFVVALGSNIKKEIPGLKLKTETQQSVKKLTKNKHNHSSQKSLGARSLSQSKKNSNNNLHRVNSQSSISKVYGRDKQHSGMNSPKSKASHKTNLSLLHKRASKGSLTRPTDQLKQSKVKVKSSSKPPFSGEDTTMIRLNKLNSSGLIVKNKNKKSLIDSIGHLSPTSKKTSMHPISLENVVNSHDVTTDSIMNVMYIPSALQTQTNKEKLIKELSHENKHLKQEQELLRKENRQLRTQIEQFEKQMEKQKNSHHQQQEVQMLYQENKKKEIKICDLKKKKKQFKAMSEEAQKKVEKTQQERDCYLAERDHVIGQVGVLKGEYQKLQSKLHDSQSKNQAFELEVMDLQVEVQKMAEASKEVEHSLLSNLQETSEKYKQALKHIDDLTHQRNIDTRKNEEFTQSIKDTQYYVSALEKENTFLREEVERTKYSKDKAEYGKFLQNLMPIRGKKPVNDENSHSKAEQIGIKSPFKEQNLNSHNAFHQRKQSMEQTQKLLLSPQIKQESAKKEQENKPVEDWSELKMSYNQKLLKSLEKKTFPKYR